MAGPLKQKMNEQKGNKEETHVLIIGGGITGLVLAQALRNHGIPFTIFERDPDPLYRGKGWGLTIHWALDAFLSLLPQELVDRIPETYVDPDAVANGENGNFLFLDLKSGEARWRVPPAKRLRVSRERLRRLLMDGIDVRWNKSLASISRPSENMVLAQFTDGTSAAGTFLVGCDGSHSITRRLLCEAAGEEVRTKNHRLDVRLLGVSVSYPAHLARKMRAIDPYFLQAGDPETDTFLWFSFLDTPNNNDRENRDTYECQILTSWPYRAGYRNLTEPLEVPKDNEGRLALMRSLADGWAEPFREIVQSIPDGVEAKSIALEDWPTPAKGSWCNFHGRATLVGDAAHAMTMFRGEAGNHGIVDVANLLEKVLPIFRATSDTDCIDRGDIAPRTLREACDAYEEEMIERCRPAVLRSRKACYDAHDYAKINETSPLVARRGAFEDDE